MKPIQLWLPAVSGGAARSARQRDIQRLHAAWDGHDIMWTKPGWNGPEAWAQEGAKVGCISGEEIECFRILHIDGCGRVCGPASALFDELPIDAILDTWLNAEVEAVQSTVGTEVELSVPTVVEGGVAYLPENVVTQAGGRYPFRRVDAIQRVTTAQWPPSKNEPHPVSPQSEAFEPAANESESAFSLRLRWSTPLAAAMPEFPSEDDLFARDQMRSFLEQGKDGIEAARRSASVAARAWLKDGQSTVNSAWFKPMIAVEGEQEALFAIETQFDAVFGSLKDAYRDERLIKELRKPMGVQGALGIPGVAWAFMLDRLSEGRSERLCERCGQPITGKADKRFCSEVDNKECFRSRKRSDRRRARQVT
ncbi:hypothetical protein [Ruegeria atlantica]|uniref:Uncharacterized protein n=1 Tax=Ruegeria atlantica TaxID=81569 RepID=A0A0N7LP82_9RHOB|nr:hypothetical protein [Ruegeria atlantica]CUH44492.1 hypothetical protein RUM4293_03394 [Ruegeria atlantica]